MTVGEAYHRKTNGKPAGQKAAEKLATPPDPSEPAKLPKEGPLPVEVAWSPQKGPQSAGVRAAFVDELFFGGAAGGGKSDFLLGDFLQDVHQGTAWQGVLFRRSYPALDELVHRSHQIYPLTGGKWKAGAYTWEWNNGAKLRFRHMETVFDFAKYLGHSWSWIGFDELPEWEDMACYNRTKSRMRGQARHKRMRSTGNPGGPGHHAVQSYFGIPDEPLTLDKIDTFTDPETGMTRMFIPSRVEDNRALLDSDPHYVSRLKGVGDPELVKAWLQGDWRALVGGFFNWVAEEVYAEPFMISEGWPLFAAIDYGEFAPCCCLLFTVDYDERVYVIGEYYEAERSAHENAAGIKEMIQANPFTQGRHPDRIYAPHDMWIRRRLGEDSSNAAEDVFREADLSLTKAAVGREAKINGWRIINTALHRGFLKVFRKQAPNLMRTAPTITRDDKNREDISPRSEDHALDALRYGLVHVYTPVEAPKPKDNNPFLGTNIIATQRKLAKMGAV